MFQRRGSVYDSMFKEMEKKFDPNKRSYLSDNSFHKESSAKIY